MSLVRLESPDSGPCAHNMKRFAKNPSWTQTQREIEMPTGLHLNAALFSTALLATALAATPTSAQKKYDIGATDTEIKIGNTIAYSGPASNYGVIAKAEAAYFN